MILSDGNHFSSAITYHHIVSFSFFSAEAISLHKTSGIVVFNCSLSILDSASMWVDGFPRFKKKYVYQIINRFCSSEYVAPSPPHSFNVLWTSFSILSVYSGKDVFPCVSISIILFLCFFPLLKPLVEDPLMTQV